MSTLISFYSGTGTDDRHRQLREILSWDDARLEDVHDYIQWLFPLEEASRFNPDAPLLTPEDIAAFTSDPTLRNNVRRSFERMLKFYGFKATENAQLERTADFPAKSANWLTKYSHNFLRITRILKCLSTVGMRDEAMAFLNILKEIYKKHRRVIGTETMEYWKGAV